MASEIIKGLYLVTCSGGSSTKPATCKVSTTPGHEVWTSDNSVKRPRPKNVTLAPITTYSKSRKQWDRVTMPGNYGNTSVAPTPSQSIFPASQRGELDNKMQYAFLDKVKDTTWNVSVFIGELPEALSFFTSAAKAVWQSYLAVKRGNMRKMKRVLKRWYRQNNLSTVFKGPASGWLAWRFAISPLVGEVDSMLAALAQTGLAPHVKRVAVNSIKIDTTAVTSAGVLQSRYFSTLQRRGAYFTVEPIVNAWKNLGLTNSLEMLYNLTPLSFVFDYFVPLGKSIAALDAAAGVTWISKWKSNRTRERHENAGKGWVSKFKSDSYSRTVNGDGIPFPTYQPHITVPRYFDLLALITSLRPLR